MSTPGDTPHELFKTIVDHAPVGLAFAGPSGNVEYANERWRVLAGYQGPLPVGNDLLLSLVHPDDQGRTMAALTRSQRNAIEVRESIRMNSEEIQQVVVAFRTLRDQGELVGVLVGLSDVSELSSAVEEVRRSEERFRSIAASLPVGVYRITPLGRLLWANERMSEITGTTTVDGTGTSVFEYTHPDDHDQVLHASRQAVVRGERFESRHRIITATGQVKWVLSRTTAIQDASGEIVEFVGSLEDITDLHRESEQLAHQAAHDPLTNLPNRASLTHLIESLALEGPQRNDIGIIFVDLDRFKDINDTWGHQAGDMVLVEVAQRLKTVIRSADTVGRYGGDEFLVVCPGITDIAVLHEVAGRIADVVSSTPIEAGDNKFALTASVGIALGPEDGGVDELLHRADAAMYKSKRDRR